MAEKVLVAGASGALGLEVLKLLKQENREIRALTHSPEGAADITPYTNDIWQADASKGLVEIEDITRGVSTVISAMGKSVSLFTPDEKSFMDNDFYSNNNLLDDAIKNGVKRFIYISIKGADTGREYEIAKAHKMFEDALRSTDLDYTIIRPVGFFSGLNDLAIMAKRKVIPVIGSGKARTNSIHQRDLAELVVNYLENGPDLIEVGGPFIHTRLEMAEMIRDKIGGKIIKVPEKVAELGMILPEIISQDISSKLKYFKYITSHDMIGEKTGRTSFKEYLERLDIEKDLP